MAVFVRGVACLFAASIAWAGVADATAEPTGAHRFRIAFTLDPVDAPIAIFASHWPDHLEDTRPLVVTGSSPYDVLVDGWRGRPYFHLKAATGGTRVVSIRRLPLEGQNNFRDLGGYRAVDGRFVRWGLLYRSGQLASLTERDFEYLKPLGIRLVCDCRTNDERAHQPTHWPGDAPEVLATPIGADATGRNTRVAELKRLLTERAAPEEMRAFMMSIYPGMPMEAAPQFRQILTRLLSIQGASMVHCSAGKDRTGIFSALLLLTLGVPRETVIEDYLLTNRYVAGGDAIARTAVVYQKLAGLPAAPPVEVLTPLVIVERSYMEAALATIDKKYGSFDAYRRERLRLSDADVETLRAKYLEP